MDREHRLRIAYETPVWNVGGEDDLTLGDICHRADKSGELGGITAHTVVERIITAYLAKA